MRLKVGSGGKDVVLSVDDGSSVAEFVCLLQKERLVENEFSIKFGFPPQTIDLSDGLKLLKDIGVRSGDKLSVIQKQEVKEEVKSLDVPKEPTTPHIKLSNGYLALVKIPEDNSCLFRSISTSGFQGLVDPSELRSVVADTIRENRDGEYNAVFLGKPVDEYVDWIIKPTSWGGAIEIDILSKYLGLCIKSIDVETGRVDSFNSDAENFIIVFYTGIHYDTVEFIDNIEENITNFVEESPLGQEVLLNVNKLSKKLNHKGYVTNTSTFNIKCKVCNTILKGEREASQHASETMHYEFGEV